MQLYLHTIQYKYIPFGVIYMLLLLIVQKSQTTTWHVWNPSKQWEELPYELVSRISESSTVSLEPIMVFNIFVWWFWEKLILPKYTAVYTNTHHLVGGFNPSEKK